MRYFLLLVSCLISLQTVQAEFYDPMRPPAYALEKFRLQKIKNTGSVIKQSVKPTIKEVWVLSSILYSSDRQHAIINNKLVKKGEMIMGAKLVGLAPGSVRLLSKGKFIDLKVYDTDENFKSIKKSLKEKKI